MDEPCTCNRCLREGAFRLRSDSEPPPCARSEPPPRPELPASMYLSPLTLLVVVA